MLSSPDSDEPDVLDEETVAEIDASRMASVVDLASRGWGRTAPNPMVGSEIFAGDEMVGSGYHREAGGRHAEIVALNEAGVQAAGATMYVSLEPCNHHGRTPPCTDAIIAAGISRVVAATRDPNPAAGGGAERLRAAGIAVEFGCGEVEARELNAPFFNSFESDRPWVTLKLALSLDGAIAGAERKREWLTGPPARRYVQYMRAGTDAIAVGIETAIADDPELTAKGTDQNPVPRVPPVRIVFDTSARLSSQSRLVQTARDIPTLLVTAATTKMPAGLASAGVEALPAKDIGDALRKLRLRGITSLLVEGGAGLAAAFLAGDFVDRLVIFQAPLILGQGALGAFSGIASQTVERAPRFRVIRSHQLVDDIMTIYAMGRV
ncbi:MAG: bifunctional diaminohydroxyphosphoribosylaminopyrimidine deaminase/5-amino-6-(5-phosphoribosylamino)uracil reductase RibD [Gemmatimonadaceae bacterium]|nr:bifunctional diaminohydroxyphosphoribosylaminopyrimidine deaminase/5-amino-6-(5-phosphoribosylamino)uracil reductase RibD [Gemmatimonadaceae bacterium]